MAEFYTSGRTSNEAAFLYQIFAREYGTNNFPDCSNMCHEATSVGLPESIGIGKGTVSLDNFEHCEPIIAMGHNPGTNHPRMMGTLRSDLKGRSWADIETACGLARRDLESVAAAYAKSNATIVSYDMGIVQHLSGSSNVQQIANLLLLRGNFGKPGAGICPLRGHSNVQGDRSVGITERPTETLIGS